MWRVLWAVAAPRLLGQRQPPPPPPRLLPGAPMAIQWCVCWFNSRAMSAAGSTGAAPVPPRRPSPNLALKLSDMAPGAGCKQVLNGLMLRDCSAK